PLVSGDAPARIYAHLERSARGHHAWRGETCAAQGDDRRHHVPRPAAHHVVDRHGRRRDEAHRRAHAGRNLYFVPAGAHGLSCRLRHLEMALRDERSNGSMKPLTEISIAVGSLARQRGCVKSRPGIPVAPAALARPQGPMKLLGGIRMAPAALAHRLGPLKLLAGILMAAAALAQQPSSFEARHHHRRGGCTGRLSFDEKGVAFESQTKKGHSWQWGWLDIQQFKLLDSGEVSLLTYKDNKWRLGADREFHFQLADKQLGAQVSPILRSRLERRFVSGLPETAATPLWEIPVKHLLRISGTEGKLVVAGDRILYQTEAPGDSRAWLFSDIESIS